MQLTAAVLLLLTTAAEADYTPNDYPLPNPFGATAIVAAQTDNRLSIGTTWLYQTTPENQYWITCSHVIGHHQQTRIAITIFADGIPLPTRNATLLYQSNELSGPDVAVLATRTEHDATAKLRPIDRSRPDHAKPGEISISVGSARATWPSLFLGRIADTDLNRIRFTPEPAEGRSGSPTLDAQGRLTGMVTWRDPTNRTGISQPWQQLRDHLAAAARRQQQPTDNRPQPTETRAAASAENLETIPFILTLTAEQQRDCPGPNCPWPQSLLPRRNNPQPERDQNNPQPEPTIPWPNLQDQPNQQPAEPRKPTDLRPILPLRNPTPQAQPAGPGQPQPNEPAPQPTPKQKAKRPLQKALEEIQPTIDPLKRAIQNWDNTNRLLSLFTVIAAATATAIVTLRALSIFFQQRNLKWQAPASANPSPSTTKSNAPPTGSTPDQPPAKTP